jgi:cell division protein FtsQ
MDGERRISKPVKTYSLPPDCPRSIRIAARSFAVLFLGVTLVRGIVGGGHLEYAGSPWPKLPGKVAEMFGHAAIDIEMIGLRHHEPSDVLAQLGVRPGGSLIGFDANHAREKLEKLDWVQSARVMRRFPNQLQVTIVEREPFVVWQHQGTLAVVDRRGLPMSGVPVSSGNMLLQVVGDGANIAASGLINQMEATPDLFTDMKAAVRVGGRRWDLVMKDGLTISLPEHGLEDTLKTVETAYLNMRSGQMPVQRMDFRIAGQVIYRAKAEGVPTDQTTTSTIR